MQYWDVGEHIAEWGLPMYLKRWIWGCMVLSWLVGSAGFLSVAGQEIMRDLERRIIGLENEQKNTRNELRAHAIGPPHTNVAERLAELDMELELAKMESRNERREIKQLSEQNRSVLIYIGLAVYTNLTGLVIFLGRWLFGYFTASK